MNSLVIHLASGIPFLYGLVLIALILLMPDSFAKRLPDWSQRIFRLLLSFAFVLVIASATPVGIWFYALLVAGAIAWGIARARAARNPDAPRPQKIAKALRAFLVILALLGFALELRWHLPVQAGEAAEGRPIYLIADSISAGVDDHASTWVDIALKDYEFQLTDLSSPGETLQTAFHKATNITDENAFVLLEIGGNDLLNMEPSAVFEADLDALLSAVAAPERKLLMFELPLPPGFNGYGRVQRRLAKKYEVALIPKREFAAVLSGGDATSDGLHLSEAGARRMAEVVAQALDLPRRP